MVTSLTALAQRAATATGLSDFGPDGWQAGLEHLLDALDRDLGRLAPAVAAVEGMAVRRLMSRLEVEAWYSEQGDLGPAPLVGPLVIVGLPRTATTALHHLLSLDPRFRFPRQWEMAVPVPPPDRDTEAEDPRRLKMPVRENDVRHISSIDGPTEDGAIHALNFGHQELALPLPTYSSWWRGADLSGTFAYQERVLRLLHSRRPPRHWLLKAPAYLFHLPEMIAHYPGARFVMTHRDPLAALPSTCSVVLDARDMVLRGLPQDKAALGREMLRHFSEGVRLAMAARSMTDPGLFIDVSQEQVERDPVGTAERVYRHVGLEMDDSARRTVGEWAATNQRGSRGAHTYSAEEFGLTVGAIEREFAEYRERHVTGTSPTAV